MNLTKPITGETDDVIDDLFVNGILTQSGGSETVASSGTAAVNVIVVEGSYKQSCTFKLKDGKFKCVKE